jgi:hypothetical protein
VKYGDPSTPKALPRADAGEAKRTLAVCTRTSTALKTVNAGSNRTHETWVIQMQHDLGVPRRGPIRSAYQSIDLRLRHKREARFYASHARFRTNAVDPGTATVGRRAHL